MEESKAQDSLPANTPEVDSKADGGEVSLESSPTKDETFAPSSIQASVESGDDQSLPFYLSSLRNTSYSNTRLGNEENSQLVAESGGTTSSFAGRHSSIIPGENLITDQITSNPTTEAAKGMQSPAIVTEKSPSSLQYSDEVQAMITGIMKNGSECNPVILTLLVTNDNKSKPINVTSEASRESEAKEPPLNSEKSCAILKTELEASGIMVIPVINRPKGFLLAILHHLEKMKIPKSCEFFWFIFSGHGSHGAFAVNGEEMGFGDLIQRASKIHIKYMAFFFECCQRYGDTIRAAKIQKQYTALYSSPPDKVSYHYEGVGLVAICLAKMMKSGSYKKSFSELQIQLRHDVVKMIEEVVPIPSNVKMDDFVACHVPIQMSTMYDDFSIWSKISAAMQPSINVQMKPGNHEAVITVSNPRRIICHPSNSLFELRKNIIVLENNENKLRVILATLEAKFEEDDSPALYQTVVIPPQSCEMSGNLIVGAEYGDGRVEYSKPHDIDKLPCYEKPQIHSCVPEANQCEVSVAYTPNNTHQESKYYHIEWVEIGFHDSLWNWEVLDHKEKDYIPNTLIVLPPSREVVKRDFQVAVKYTECPIPIYSGPYIVEQPAIGTPEIKSININPDGFTATLTFNPMQPSLHSTSDLYHVDNYSIRSHASDEWETVWERKLLPGETLGEKECAVFTLPLSKKEIMLQYEVVLHYVKIGDVKSDRYEHKICAITKPEILSIIKECDSMTGRLTFNPHQPYLPSNPSLAPIKKYCILSRHKGGEWFSIYEHAPPNGILDEEESVEISLDLTVAEVTYDYKVVQHYVDSAISEISSYTFQFKITPIEKPEIKSIDFVDSVTGKLTFLPHQPVSEKNPGQCAVDRCQVRSRYGINRDWEIVYNKSFPPNTALGTERCVNICIPLSLERKVRQYEVILHYASVDLEVKSEIFCRTTKPIKQPIITSISPQNLSHTAILAFIPKQPSSEYNPKLCGVSKYYIHVRHHQSNNEWIEVLRKELGPNEFLATDIEEAVCIPLPLYSQSKRYYYRVTMCYCCGDINVMSHEVRLHVDSIGAPYDVSTSYKNYPSLSVSWKGPNNLPAGGDFEFKIVTDTLQEEELGSAPFNTHCKVINVPRNFNSPIKVGICHRSRKDLGIIYSEPYKKNVVLHQLLVWWKQASCCHKALLPLTFALFILFLATLSLLLCVASIRPSLNNRLIVANQTISFKPGWYDLYCRSGTTVHENIIKFSDNPYGLNITGYLVESNEIERVNVTIPSEEYAGVDKQIERGFKRSIIPNNYLNYPQNLLKGSTIILKTKINLKNDGILVHQAQIDYFESYEEARLYVENGGQPLKSVHTVNVTNCVNSSCSDPYPFSVHKESFYFFVLTSDVTSTFNITTNFTFHAILYANPNTHSGAINVTHISKNTPGFIPFHTSKQVLLYAHFPESGKLNIAHLNFTMGRVSFSRHLPMALLIILVITFLLMIIILPYLVRKYWRQCGSLTENGQEDNSETTRLLTSQPINS